MWIILAVLPALAGCDDVDKQVAQEYPKGPIGAVQGVVNLPYDLTRFCDGANLVYVRGAHGVQVVPDAEECGK